MKNQEVLLKNILSSGPLLDVSIYQVNNRFFELEEEGIWIIDTGIQLNFLDGIVTAAWRSSEEAFIITNDAINNVYTNNNSHKIRAEHTESLNRFIGHEIEDVQFKIVEVDVVHDHAKPAVKEERLVEMTMFFDNNTHMQIAFVDYVLEDDKPPQDFTFDFCNALLIATKSIIEIK